MVVIGDSVDRGREWAPMSGGENNERTLATDEDFLIDLLAVWQEKAGPVGPVMSPHLEIMIFIALPASLAPNGHPVFTRRRAQQGSVC